MQVTEIKVFPVEEEKLKAFVSIVIDSCFMVNDIKVIKGRDGLFISMPSRRKKNGKFKDVAHPLNNETRQMLEQMILEDYQQALDGPRVELGDEVAKGTETRPEPVGLAAAPEQISSPPVQEEPAEESSKSLEEVTEMHLRDSFWNS
jgi:stage V sporulation protein G